MAAMTRKRANSSVEYRNLHMLSPVVLLSSLVLLLLQQEYIFHLQEIKNPAVLVLTVVRCALLQAHDGLIFHCRKSGKSNRLVPQKNPLTKTKERRGNKLFKNVFGIEFGACFAEIWPFEFCIF